MQQTIADSALATHLVVSSSRFVRAAARRYADLRPIGANRVLGTLSRLGGQRVGELSALESVSQPAMTATVNRLVADGLAAKVADPTDARAAVIEITDAGRDALAEFQSLVGAAAGPVLARLSSDEVATLERATEIIDRLTADLDAV